MKLKSIKIYFALFACVLSTLGTSLVVPMTTYAATPSPDVEVCSDIYTWFYKEENGKLYKRLYNSTEGHWEGDWIYVADVG